MATVYKRGGKRNRDGWYYVGYRDHDGRRVTKCAQTTDKATAKRIARKLEADAALRREGVIDPRADGYKDHAARPMLHHLEGVERKRPDGNVVRVFIGYRHALSDKGNTAEYVAKTIYRCRRIIDITKVGGVNDLTPAAVQAALADIRRGDKENRPSSLRTCNGYLRAIKGFSKWLVRDGRIMADGLAHLKQFNESTDRRHERRALSDDELGRLIEAAENGRTAWGMTGPDRAMLYRVAVGTGLRASELFSLTRRSFDLAADEATVTVHAAYSKHRRDDVQPIRGDLAVLLGPWLKERPKAGPSFGTSDKAKTANMIRLDLEAARKKWIDDAAEDAQRSTRERSTFLQYRDDAGRCADFHALRHTYITRLVNSGASVKVAQDLARHSDPKLTIGRYAHTRIHDLRQALDNLPNMGAPARDAETAATAATGTEDARPDDASASAQRQVQRPQRDRGREGAKRYDADDDARDDADARNSLRLAADSDEVRDDATDREQCRREDSNLQPRAYESLALTT